MRKYRPKYSYIKKYKTDGVLSTFLYSDRSNGNYATVMHRNCQPILINHIIASWEVYCKIKKDSVLQDFIEQRLYEELKDF